MAVIKLENVAATASITIQLIKDYSMYESEIISSNGTIFQNSDTNTTLTFRAFKGIEEVTNKLSSIEWSKFYFKEDELQEDPVWGLNKKNQTRIIVDKDDIEGKNIIQVSGYSIVDGVKELVTTARITMIKISDIYISDITPTDPSDKMMWMDTNLTPPTLKIWSDELNYWISSGMDVPIVKNLIRNSNFWVDIDTYYTVTNSSNILTPVRTVYTNKQWITLESKNANSQSGGVTQDIQYPISASSNYIFSFIGYRNSASKYTGKNISVKIISKNKNNISTTILDGNYELKTSVSTIQVPFTTANDTETISIYIGTQNKSLSCFYATELSLYNSSVYYPWELCPDDVNNQMGAKLDNSRLAVFNTLTDNNKYKAIYESEKQYYINADYIVPAIATQETVTALNNKIASLESQLVTAQSTITALQKELKTVKDNVEGMNLDIVPMQNNVSSLQYSVTNMITTHNGDMAIFRETITQLTNRILVLEDKLNNKPEDPNEPEDPTL